MITRPPSHRVVRTHLEPLSSETILKGRLTHGLRDGCAESAEAVAVLGDVVIAQPDLHRDVVFDAMSGRQNVASVDQ